jgi:hypothetical protein
LFCLFAAFYGCNSRPKVTIEGDTAPRFKIAGQGSVQTLTVSGPDFNNPHSSNPGSRYMKPYWQIVAQGARDIALLEASGGIVYGKVPNGFKQTFPENDGAPQPLSENELFTFDLRLADGQAVGMRFVIHNGKASSEGS